MPELPEVEVTRRRIAPFLIGRRIAEVTTSPPSYFFVTPPSELKRRLSGRRTIALERVGKYLVACLDDGSRLLLHLGMTGQLFPDGVTSPRLLSARRRARLKPQGSAPFRRDRHTHLVLHFADDGPVLFFRDIRKFGKCAYLLPGESSPRLDKLGIDALGVTGSALFEATRHRKIPIKTLLLDQSVLAGVGNIYADEALHLAGVRPTRRSDRVTKSEARAIAGALRRVLCRSIAAGGSSIDDFVQPDGSDGRYQDERHVYGRAGEHCARCGTRIRRIVLGQRSSHYCPRCQQ